MPDGDVGPIQINHLSRLVSNSGGLVTADGMVPMGVKNALAVVEQQVIDPAPQRGFVMSNSGCLHTR